MSEPSSGQTPPELAGVLAELYRERIDPRPGDEYYPHLLDIRDAVAETVLDETGIWLDYGASTSPYRSLFVKARLQTADLAAQYEKYPVDYVLDEDGSIPVADGTFDGVLSTQVLEHVIDPGKYLGEAMRVIRPGGRLVLTTHGVWEDHGSIDMRRWTAQGLQAEIENAGFAVERCLTLTCGARAVLHLLQQRCRAGAWPGRGPVSLLLRGFGALDRRRQGVIDRYSDRRLDRLRIAPAGEQSFYLTILVSARKPASTQE